MLTQRCPSAHPGGEDEPHLGPAFPELERPGSPLWPVTMAGLARWAEAVERPWVLWTRGLALPSPHQSLAPKEQEGLVCWSRSCPAPLTPMRGTPLDNAVLCEATCWGPIPTGSALELLLRLQAGVTLPKPPLGRQELPVPCCLTATRRAPWPFARRQQQHRMLPGVTAPGFWATGPHSPGCRQPPSGQKDSDSKVQDVWPPTSAQGQQACAAIESAAAGRPCPLRMSLARSRGAGNGGDRETPNLALAADVYE